MKGLGGEGTEVEIRRRVSFRVGLRAELILLSSPFCRYFVKVVATQYHALTGEITPSHQVGLVPFPLL